MRGNDKGARDSSVFTDFTKGAGRGCYLTLFFCCIAHLVQRQVAAKHKMTCLASIAGNEDVKLVLFLSQAAIDVAVAPTFNYNQFLPTN